jgi:hypothetical protein
MTEIIINVFFSIALLLCRNPATTWLSGFSMGTAVSLWVFLYLS